MQVKINEKTITTVLLIIFILTFGFTIRITTLTNNGLLYDPDSYFWYKLAMYFSGLDTDFIEKRDGRLIYTQAYYPTGRDLSKEILFLPYTIGVTFKFFSSINLIDFTKESLMRYMMYFGAFFGALAGVVLFFLFKEITNNTRVSFFSSLIYLASYAAFSRNTAGDAGQESLGFPLIFLWMLLFIKAIKEETLKRYVIYVASSIVIFSLASLTWGGNEFFLRVLGVTANLYILYLLVTFKRNDRFFVTYVSLVYTSNFIRAMFTERYSLIPALSFENILIYCLPVVLYAFNVLFIEIHKRFKIERKKVLAVFLLMFLVLGFVYNIKTGAFEKLYSYYIKGEKSLTGNTVAYYRTSSFEDFKNYHKYLLIFLPIGLAYIVSMIIRGNRRFELFLLIVWTILSIQAAYWMIRLHMFLSATLAILTVLTLDLISKQSKRYGRLIFFLFVGLILLDVTSKGISYATGMKYADIGVMPWKDAGEWIKNNTEKNSLLIHWWDYGYYLQVFADRYTIVDGGNAGPPIPERNGSWNRNIDVALAFLSPEEEFERLMYIYNPDNLPTYVLVSLEELGKSWAINYHATNGGKYTRIFLYNFVIPSTGNASLDIQIISRKLNDIRIVGRISYSIEKDTYYVYVPVRVPVDDRRYTIVNYVFTYKSTGNKTKDVEEIKRIARTVSLRNYLIIPRINGYDIWVQIGKEGDENLLLAKLLPLEPNGKGRGLKHFKLVYTNGWVYIYKYVQ